MSTADEARAGAWAQYREDYQPNRFHLYREGMAYRAGWEDHAGWQASRKVEAAPSDTDREALKRVAELASGDHITESMAEYRAATSPDNEPTVWELEFWHAGYKRGALAIIDYLAASQPVQVEVTAPPCDGGCNYNSGPEETCSVHGRPVAEVWGIVQQIGTERDKYRAAIEDALASESVLPAIATAPRNILSTALGGGES